MNSSNGTARRRPEVRSADKIMERALKRESTDMDRLEGDDNATRQVKNAAKRKANNSRTAALLGILAFALLLVIVWRVMHLINGEADKLIRDVTVEVGSTASESMFFSEEPNIPQLVSCNLNFDAVDYSVPQDIHFTITMYWANIVCTLHIVDTTPPAAQAVPQTLFSTDALPDASSCVTGITDATAVTVSWLTQPDIASGGNLTGQVLLSDSFGNVSVIDVPFNVTKDVTPPVISGAKDLTVYIGDSIAYRDGVTVTDDIDQNPTLTIDADSVDLTTPGTYIAGYTATDFSGNKSTRNITVTVEEKPATYVEPEVVYAAARDILSQITTDDMSDMEKALQIVWWCRYNIHYAQSGDSSSWERAAYNGLVNRTGTCYTFAYAAKAMFDCAGIDNEIVRRDPYIHEKHFWNYIGIDGQWYHCDSTPRHLYSGYFFMYTTEELEAVWMNGWNGYSFDESKHPASATESVQDRIDYANHTIIGDTAGNVQTDSQSDTSGGSPDETSDTADGGV